jgi:hypothetical protein
MVGKISWISWQRSYKGINCKTKKDGVIMNRPLKVNNSAGRQVLSDDVDFGYVSAEIGASTATLKSAVEKAKVSGQATVKGSLGSVTFFVDHGGSAPKISYDLKV